MPSFRNKRRVPYTPAQMFDLVADVEQYPAFLPLCEALRVRRRAASGEGVETLIADMTVGYKAIRETFTSRVTLDRPRLRILVEYVDGPFRHLENRWAFHQLDDVGCEVDFFISYEFKSMALGLVMGAVFERAFHKFAEAFEERARTVYGRGGGMAARV
ncbi:type II toxin-antitoxin system RatA family toxin [Chelatococcus composti]|jgi:coenzyme Q-binding protein COQ10|uniref:Coenzyme Q-binding protein COQ10 n=1 Tax=Chelatococcus composti TaxID=1743235 RepID=A0A841K394_9HYPH|nr:type II toxin-antitoxin system RatA family toxin [Chelatococcus composti]MBB6166961.1 coenzyme Q-binding protein COQ10 [Chelatococcus composti]MBS7737138.1 type II toxin-antitoxin system RatA family toxin [Chelatococcus composti]PZN45773.1 MAG: ubiquinone-binding protein [Pseudomonadota bacterium]GGG24502.1 ubiquinone-binding protein [Chelatococcus composti]